MVLKQLVMLNVD